MSEGTEPSFTYELPKLAANEFPFIEEPRNAQVKIEISDDHEVDISGNQEGLLFVGTHLIAMGLQDSAYEGHHVHLDASEGGLDADSADLIVRSTGGKSIERKDPDDHDPHIRMPDDGFEEELNNLYHPDEDRACWSATFVGQIGSKSAIPDLLEAKGRSIALDYRIDVAILRIEQGSAAVANAYHESDARLNTEALLDSISFDESEEVRAVWVEELMTEDHARHSRAADQIRLFQHEIEYSEVAPRIIELLSHPPHCDCVREALSLIEEHATGDDLSTVEALEERISTWKDILDNAPRSERPEVLPLTREAEVILHRLRKRA